MAYVKIWVHCVWGTKNRFPYLNNEVLKKVIEHINVNAKKNNIYIDRINGFREHIHCIISLGPDQAISKVIQLIKGESSFWINKNKLTKYRFEWAVEYYGASLSGSHLKKVRNYIENQENHHKKRSMDDENNEFFL